MYNAAMLGTFGPDAGPKFRDLTEEQQKDLRLFLTGQKKECIQEDTKDWRRSPDCPESRLRVCQAERHRCKLFAGWGIPPRMLDMPLVETDIHGFLSQAYNLYKDVIFINEFLFEDVSDYDQIQKLDQQLAKRKVVQGILKAKIN